MVSLLHLPNEVLLIIYAQCPDVRTAVTLSTAHRLLYQLWLVDSHSIILRILRLTMGTFDDALELAFQESRYQQPEQTTLCSHTMDNKSPVSESAMVPRLLRNASLATSATKGCQLFWDLATVPKHYYLLRKLVSATKYSMRQEATRKAEVWNLMTAAREDLASNDPDAGNAPLAMIEKLLDRDLKGMSLMASFLLGIAGDEERERQGVQKPEDEWTDMDKMLRRPNSEEWMFVYHWLLLAKLEHGL